jgi:uncharacterized protein (DUF305 family)
MNRKASATAIALAAALALTGCTVNIGSEQNGGMMNSQSSYSSQDIMFAQMMIPHHQQAVDMGTLAETRASDPAVKKLAAQIKAEQAPEIEQMKGWLKAAGEPLEMGHHMSMDGMLSDAQMSALENSSGKEFDRLYLEGMIQHHEGAIEMAKMVTDSENAAAHKLGHGIHDSQTEQIAYMKELLSKL